MTLNLGCKYLHSVFTELDQSLPFEELIADGVVLSRFLQILCPEANVRIDKRDQLFIKAANVENFTRYCQSVGIPSQFIPTPTEVVGKQADAMRDVEICLWIISKLSKVGHWEGADKNVVLDGIRIDEVKPKTAVQEAPHREPEAAGQEQKAHESKNKPKTEKKEAKAEKKEQKAEKKEKRAKMLPPAPENEAPVVVVQKRQQQSPEELRKIEEKACYQKQNLTVLHFPEPNDELPTYSSNIIVAGAPGVGKTTFCMRLHTGVAEFDPKNVPQLFERTYLHLVDRKPANLHLKVRESNRIEDIQGCQFLFLCFSFNSRASFDEVPRYLNIARKAKVDVILLGMKADDKQAGITFEMINEMLEKYKRNLNSFMYHSMSALKGYGIGALLDGLEFYTNRDSDM